MKNQVVRIVAGVLVSAIVISGVPSQIFADSASNTTNYITGSTYSFSAGAHAAINETVVLNNTESDMLFAGVSSTDAPVVASAVWNNPYKNIGIADVSEYVYIRSEANAESEYVGKLYVNGAATVLETLDGWYKVTSGDVTGYVAADYLTVGDPAVCEAAGEKIATIKADNLKVRKDTNTDSDVVTYLTEGARVSVMESGVDGWLKVEYGTYSGYISADYVTIEVNFSYAESKEAEEARLEAEAEARRQAQAAAAAAAAEEARRQQAASAAEKNYVAPSGGSGQSVADYAVQFVGNPYVWGGTSLTNGADCSGFVQSVYKAFGVSLPRTSYQQRSAGYAVSAAEMQPGDIVCYSGHVAIYIGGGKIVHASNRTDGIKISNNYNYAPVLAIRRIY